MVAFHEGMGLSSTIAGESLFRNRIPETPQARRLCNGMKSNISNSDDELHLGGAAKPGIEKDFAKGRLTRDRELQKELSKR